MRLFRKMFKRGGTVLKKGDPTEDRTYLIGKSPIRVGRYTYGQEYLTIKQWGEGAGLQIGAFCSISDSIVVFLGGNHRTDWITTFPFGHIFQKELGAQKIAGHPKTNGDVIIGNDVWIGRNSTLMSGIHIGDGAVIAANSTVVKDIGPYEIWGGNPARLISRRFELEVVDLLLKLRWWDWDEDRIRNSVPILSNAPSVEALLKLQANDSSR